MRARKTKEEKSIDVCSQARRETVQAQQTGELDPLTFGVTEGGDGGLMYEDLRDDSYDCCYDSCWNPGSPDLITPSQKMEPKQFFANERTYIHWLHNAVMLASISSGILALAERESIAEVYALCLLPISFSFVGYALYDTATIPDYAFVDAVFPVTIASASLVCGLVLLLQMRLRPETDALFADRETGSEDVDNRFALWPTLAWFAALLLATQSTLASGGRLRLYHGRGSPCSRSVSR